MDKKELLKTLKSSSSLPVFGWVNIYQNDGEYLQINKSSFIDLVKRSNENIIFAVTVRDCDGIYIN